MDIEERDEILELCADLIPRVVHAAGFSRDSCIIQARVALGVLDHFRIDAVQIPVNVLVFNPEYLKRVTAGETAMSVEELDAMEGCCTIGIGFGGKRPGYWEGHLIVGDTGAGWMMDTSIGQADRPAHGIALRPFVCPMPDRIADGTNRHWMTYDGCALGYQRISDGGYRRAIDWTDRTRRDCLIGAVIRGIKKCIVV